MRGIKEVEEEIEVLRKKIDELVADGIPNHVPSAEVLQVSQEIDKLLVEYNNLTMMGTIKE